MNELIRVLICDDEPPARENLRLLLGEDRRFVLTAECGHGRAGLERLRRGGIDVAFLDVEMPGVDGLKISRACAGDGLPLRVFVTAHSRYSLQAFEEEAVDYLLKPFDDRRFADCLDRIARRFVQLRRPEPDARLCLRSSERSEFVAPTEIEWIEARDYRCRVHLPARSIDLRETLSSMLRRLDRGRFVRCHRSAVVRVGAVSAIERRGSAHQLLLRSGARVPLARGHRRWFEELLA